jgi:hypothetical protein
MAAITKRIFSGYKSTSITFGIKHEPNLFLKASTTKCTSSNKPVCKIDLCTIWFIFYQSLHYVSHYKQRVSGYFNRNINIANRRFAFFPPRKARWLFQNLKEDEKLPKFVFLLTFLWKLTLPSGSRRRVIINRLRKKSNQLLVLS